MHCPKCGIEISHYSKYCSKCGTKLPYNKEFEKNKYGSDLEDEGFFTTNKQIIFLSILGLIVILLLSAFAVAIFNQEKSSDTASSLDDFINNTLVSPSDDSEDVEYYYPSTGYEISKSNDDFKLSNISDNFFNYYSFNKSV